ncbi:MAG: hypothetical protein ACD_6C00249G0001, partial [uncultured bacterium]
SVALPTELLENLIGILGMNNQVVNQLM